MTPSATVIADSISPLAHRLTTLEVVMHRFVLAEFNTHRVFSRNSASSRAIPFQKHMRGVQENPAVPVSFPAEQPGMQGGNELDPYARDRATAEWIAASQSAVEYAARLAELGVHRSICNRLLEPFMWHTVVVTSTDWKNFFEQRCSLLAQPEIRMTAEAMQRAIDTSSPCGLEDGDWHLPYMTQDDMREVSSQGLDARHISAAKCAGVSYMTQNSVRDLRKIDQLYQRLITANPPHMSPLEHVATPTKEYAISMGNLRGWTQLRTRVWGRTL